MVTRILAGHDAELDAVLALARHGGDVAAAEERDDELAVFLHGLRLVKDEWEIEQLRKACVSTAQGFRDVVGELSRAIATSERWIEGTFWRRARVEGNDVGYGSICAAGPHATTLHWVRNDGEVRPGELLLLDAGVETDTLYTADVTRTLPIDGAFNELQRKIYQAVLRRAGGRHRGRQARRATSATSTRPRSGCWSSGSSSGAWSRGRSSARTNSGCTAASRCTAPATCSASTCTTARTPASRSTSTPICVPGMVLTVEPGLYFQLDDLTVPEEYRGIGVRIEDDILVTAQGNENLSGGLPRAPEDVERWMADLKG